MNTFKIGDIVHSSFQSKKECIWRVRDIITETSPVSLSPNAIKANDGNYIVQLLNLELMFAPGKSKKRTITVHPSCCSLVKKEEVQNEINKLQQNITTLNNLLPIVK